MPFGAVENRTGLTFRHHILMDEEGRPLLVGVAKLTYRILPGQTAVPAERPTPIHLDPVYAGKPGASSLLFEPETAPSKPAVDVVVHAHACAASTGVTEVTVQLDFEETRKTLQVFGDRFWVRSLGLAKMTRPRAFERIPLVYERSFGGVDVQAKETGRPWFEPRNPVGLGFRRVPPHADEEWKLPNIEDMKDAIRRTDDSPAPAGFGFVSPDWEPRARLAGTFDGAWDASRRPLLPIDFDRRYFNAASAGLAREKPLRGGERVRITGVSPAGDLRFSLPTLPNPVVTVVQVGREDARIELRADTVLIRVDDGVVDVTWRGACGIGVDPASVTAVRLSVE